jgi:anti-anti-sigma regulatory factor
MLQMSGCEFRQAGREQAVSVQATDQATGTVNCVHLADGKLVQLSGRLGRAELPALRLALLTPLFDDCRDVVVDAGEVEAVDDEAIAVLVAAEEWATYAGARLLLSRATPAFEQALIELDLADRIPRLSQLGPNARRPALVPVPRSAAD